MLLYHTYASPIGEISVCGTEKAICGLWFTDQKKVYAPTADLIPGTCDLFEELDRWLELYFSGRDPGVLPPIQVQGTDFQKVVWALVAQIPYGTTVTYGQLAEQLGRSGAAQAVGGAVGHNPAELLIPCHRVVGSGGSLTGYAGGIPRKAALLILERNGLQSRYRP